MLIIYGICLVYFIYLIISIIRDGSNEKETWLKMKYSENNLDSNNIKIELKKELEEIIVLSNDNRLYYGCYNRIFVEIKIDEILKVDYCYKTSTSTIKQPLSVVGKYKTVTNLLGIEISIVTDSKTYYMLLDRESAEQSQRLALILNDMIESRKINVVENKTTLIDSNNSNEGYCINCGSKVVAKFCGECGTQNYKYNAAGDEA